MRIVFDHGMGAMVRPPSPGTPGGGRDAVMVIHTGAGARNYRMENGLPAGEKDTRSAAAREEGLRIPGTGLVMGTSEDAVARDTEVRGHEKAHLLALGANAASGINLITKRGPDGRSYAVGGSVKIDAAPVPGNPEATLRKANSIIHAATAPGDPSAADMRVAAQAYRMASKATQEIRTRDIYA